MIWRPSSHSTYAKIADFFTGIFAIYFSYLLWEFLYDFNIRFISQPFELNELHLVSSVFVALLLVNFYYKNNAYSYQRFTSLKTEYKRIFKVCTQVLLISVTVIFLLGEKTFPRTIFFISYLLILLLYFIQKTVLYKIASVIRKTGKDRKRILIVGTSDRSKKFIDIVKNNFDWGIDIVGLLSDNSNEVGKGISGHTIINTYHDMESVLKHINPDEILITLSTRQFDTIRNILDVCKREGVKVRINSDYLEDLAKNISIDNIYGLNIISLHNLSYNKIGLFAKRVIDIIGAIVALLIFLPFITLGLILVFIQSGRPLFYEWNVIGYNKKPFKSWKIRTMVKDADKLKARLENKNQMNGPVFKIKDDPRVIPIGRWLRKWSIDETPQLLSVLKGDMSLVGPRPSFPDELSKYESWQRRKLSVKPGITCLWQINGRNEIIDFDKWVKLDLEYIDNWSIWLDIKILLKTIPAVIFKKGAC